MTFTTDDVFQAAFDLPYDSRRELAERLLETLEEKDQAAVKREWQEEVERRIQAIKNGTVKLIPADEVFDSARSQVRR